MRVRDILDAPQLRMGLLHGDAAALERAVARVCVTDMPDPRPFVTSGALVCTGLVWRHGADDSERYIAMLARAGATGVVAGQALHGFVPEDVVAACARHDLPLLSSPQSVPFSRVIEHLAEQAAETRWQRVRSGLLRQRRLLAAVADGSEIGDLLTDIAAECGFSAWLLTATGAMVAATAPLSEGDIDRVLATALTAPRLPAVAAGGITVLPVCGRSGDRISAWYLVIRTETGCDRLDADSAGAELAAVAELYRVRQSERLRLRWDLADRLPEAFPEASGDPLVAIVCEVCSPGPVGDIESDADGSATATGIDSTPIPTGPASSPMAVRSMLHDVLADVVTGLDRAGRVVGYLPGDETEVAALLLRGFGRLRPVLGSGGIGIGVSALRHGETLSGALASATAVAPAESGQVRVRVADIDSAAGLFTAIPDQLQRRFAERVLGAVVDYDRRTNAGLLHTLEVFLGCEGSWRLAAERMHLHLNTVRYRIGRVEELTGRDLGRLDDRLDLYLAVRTLAGYTAPV
ncbi:PucR family transcriptional regulator [Nocardia uniformis]|uniref:PucR family transcriptional regulator n=1 Tax=Nocardia uniformis TaxID=53432 RepID=A0A849C8M8_9NOCA|nr:PucR family transcriptional regulator [Nocardia uniformis]NNH74176.1 PucR family transcriptional regulator [Nocardia uniformis]